MTAAQKRRAVERAAAWAIANPDKAKANKRKYLEKNRFGKVLDNKKKWQKKHPEKARAACRKWHNANPDKVLAKNARRRALEVSAVVPLTLQEQATVIGLYATARAMSELAGEPYHVDHIKPLSKGGLHHPSNLQVLRGVDNLRKGAKL